MTDYTSTFTEGVGDTIDASDFSTEFDAIETAIATKLDEGALIPNYAGGATVSGTAKTASGASTTFTGIPSWVKKITLSCSGVSLSTNGNWLICIGTGGALTTSGYSCNYGFSKNATAPTVAFSSAGLFIGTHAAGTTTGHAQATITLIDSGSNLWAMSGIGCEISATPWITHAVATVSLAGALDVIGINCAGAYTFDAGTVNILYEG